MLAYHYEESHNLSFDHRLELYFTTKLSIKLSIYKSGVNREEMDDVCTPKLRYLTYYDELLIFNGIQNRKAAVCIISVVFSRILYLLSKAIS